MKPVSKEIAYLLKDLGIKIPSDYCYSGDTITSSVNCYDSDPYAPTLYEVFEYLINEEIFINITFDLFTYTVEILAPKHLGYKQFPSLMVDLDKEQKVSYKKALEKGILTALKLLRIERK